MPRILPRLLERMGYFKDELWTPLVLPRATPKSLYKPVPPRPSFHPAHHPHSILLAPVETNPITSSRVYNRHKTLPPRTRLSRRIKPPPGQYDAPREMSKDELQWWSNPYLRMLASPIRKCVVTGRYLPSDFMIRLASMRLPRDLQPDRESTPQATLIPDGLQHSRFTARRANRAAYMLCNREAISHLVERAAYKRVTHNSSVHALLAQQIEHLLRVRVLQELELLGDRMESLVGRQGAVYKSRIIRRLTREEWKSTRATGVIPYQNGVAVLVVPPLNRDPISKTRPDGSMSTSPLVEHALPTPLGAPPPLSTLHLTTTLETVDNSLPQARIPLYNGVALFPARAQRAAFYTLLTRLLDIETRSPHTTSVKTAEKVNSQDKKASHGFLLCSDAERADVAAVGIALWRVRMFEGGGWDASETNSNAWVNNIT